MLFANSKLSVSRPVSVIFSEYVGQALATGMRLLRLHTCIVTLVRQLFTKAVVIIGTI